MPGFGKVYILPLDVPDREAHGVTPFPRPAVCLTQALVLPVRCPPLTAWPRGHPRSVIQVLFLLVCLPLCCLWRWCVGGYYEKIRIYVAIATESEHDLVRWLGRSVEGVASGRGSVAGDRACPSAPSPPPSARYSVAQARTNSKGRLSRRPSDPGCVLATGGASVGV